jgi:hypothetical protein
MPRDQERPAFSVLRRQTSSSSRTTDLWGVMPQAGRRGKPRLRRSFALPAPGLPAWPRLRAEILQIKLTHMGYSPGLSTLSKCPNCSGPKGPAPKRQENLAQPGPGFTLGELVNFPHRSKPLSLKGPLGTWYGENRLKIGPPTHFYASSPFRAKHVLLANPGLSYFGAFGPYDPPLNTGPRRRLLKQRNDGMLIPPSRC